MPAGSLEWGFFVTSAIEKSIGFGQGFSTDRAADFGREEAGLVGDIVSGARGPMR